jgi:DNA invertase Pin-like site-specific DNA recombinase
LKRVQAPKERGVDVVFFDQPQLNAADKYGAFLLTVLAGVAELERSLIKERPMVGISYAKANGTKRGKKGLGPPGGPRP